MPQTDPLWTTAEVSAYYRIPIATLHQWHSLGIGPRTAKIGRHLRYRKSDLDAYFDRQARGGNDGGAAA
jgi:hypothetical protein